MAASPNRHERVRTERNVTDYKTLGDAEHVYRRPGMFLGILEPRTRPEWVLNLETQRCTLQDVSISEAILRLFLEIISNAGDNSYASRLMGVDPGSIDVTMDRQWITVINGGKPIPIQPHVDYPDKYIPQIVFGQLRSGSNLEDDFARTGTGVNGYGSKLVNIYSTNFKVRCANAEDGKIFVGEWRNNMRDPPTVEVKPWKATAKYPMGFTEISWKLDWPRFSAATDSRDTKPHIIGCPGYIISEYPDEAIGLMARYTADMSLACKIPTTFNNVKLNYSGIRDYASMYWDADKCESAIVHYEWENDTPPEGFADATSSEREALVANPPDNSYIPMIEMFAADMPDDAASISMVNGMITQDGGVHVKAAYSAISKVAIDTVRASFEGRRKPRSTDKNKKKEDKDKIDMPRMTLDDVRPHVSTVVTYRVKNPHYKSQSKTELDGVQPKINLPEILQRKIEGWDLIDRLTAQATAKMFKSMEISTTRSKKHVDVGKGEDANWAGKERSLECVLYLVEGISASAYPKKRIGMTQVGDEGGKNSGGYFPLKGKFPNVTKMRIGRIVKNAEIMAIKRLGGLSEGVDYTQEENIAKLRYGFFLINVDADSDGFHIASLLINYFHTFFPSLIAMGRLGYLRTPVVRIFSKGKTTKVVERFYTTESFDKFIAAKDAAWRSRHNIKYYKGLGTSQDRDIKDDLENAPTVVVTYDPAASKNLHLAFDPSQADARKDWIKQWRDVTGVDDIELIQRIEGVGEQYRQQTITSYLNRELVTYTIDALFRAIPSFADGLKRSQRQALYAALTRWNYKSTPDKEIKVGRFANYAADLTKYHHGEVSLSNVVVKMAHEFVGSNNLPYFYSGGQFGTRHEGGADAAEPRYIETWLDWWVPYVYDPAMTSVIKLRVVDGEEAEPMWLPAIIPMHLVNGQLGVATGHSTFIPPHNPYDIIDWLLKRCAGVVRPGPIKPWYRNFKGNVTMVSAAMRERLKKEREEERAEERAEDSPSDQTSTVDGTEEDEEEDDEGPAIPAGSRQEEDQALIIAEANSDIAFVSLQTEGIFETTKRKGVFDVKITELPIGYWTGSYRRWLHKLDTEKEINSFSDNCNEAAGTISFTIKGFKRTPNFRNLGLRRSFGMTNMTMINDNGLPHKFESTENILDTFYENMLQVFEAVKTKNLNDIAADIDDCNYRIRFIRLVIDKTLDVTSGKMSEDQVHTVMQEHEIPVEYLRKVSLHSFTTNEIEKLQAQIAKLDREYAALEKITPEQAWTTRLLAFQKELKAHKYS